MTASVPRRIVALQVALSLALLAAAACREDRPVGPAVGDPSFAKGGSSTDPTVTSTTPSTAGRDTTLDVTVAGSGFEAGSRAIWALDGDTTFARTKVKTNSTTYVSNKQLIANITISLDATIDLYDVQVVTLSGRKGIGIELFAVTPSVTITLVGPATGSEATNINDAGLVVGYTGKSYEVHRAFVWTPSVPRGTTGTFLDIGTLGGASATASAVNESGWVVGTTSDAAGVLRSFLWTAAGGMRDMGAPAMAQAINDAGQVVGGFDDGTEFGGVGRYVVTIAQDGSVQSSGFEDMGRLPDSRSPAVFSINRLGQAVGWVTTASNRPVLWTRDATGWIVENLGMLPGAQGAVARDVNDAGLVVGYSTPPQGCPSAVLWTTAAGRVTGMRVLPTLGGCGGEAYGINNQGDVVGRSVDQRGNYHATLWTVTPDGSVTSVRDLGTTNGSGRSLAYHVSERIDNVIQAVGLCVVSSKGINVPQATLWTVK